MTHKKGKAAYKLELSRGCSHQALRGIHDVLHASLLKPHCNKGLVMDILRIKVDSEVEFEVEKILKQRNIREET